MATIRVSELGVLPGRLFASVKKLAAERDVCFGPCTSSSSSGSDAREKENRVGLFNFGFERLPIHRELGLRGNTSLGQLVQQVGIHIVEFFSLFQRHCTAAPVFEMIVES